MLHDRVVKYDKVPLAPFVSKNGSRLCFAVLLQAVQQLHRLILVKAMHLGDPVQVEIQRLDTCLWVGTHERVLTVREIVLRPG